MLVRNTDRDTPETPETAVLSLVIPNAFAVPLMLLLLSGAVTFVVWLVKTNSSTAVITAKVVEKLDNLNDRVGDLEKWMIEELKRQRDLARSQR